MERETSEAFYRPEDWSEYEPEDEQPDTRPDGMLRCGHHPDQHPTAADAARCRERGW